MRLVSYLTGAGQRVGIVEGDIVRDGGLSPFAVEPGPVVGTLGAVPLGPPLPRPGKVVGIGLNYRDHALEAGLPIPEEPVVFAKFATSVTGPGAPIRIPAGVTDVDYEAELAVVIGRRVTDVDEADALDAVLGYTCLNDVSARVVQFSGQQWVRGKSFDTFCPMGPWIVTTDELPDPQCLAIRATVNGEVLQDSSTKQMIFSVAELVSFVSRGTTLEPGDVIATGTPPGVGFARTPPVFLEPGDEVTVEIEGIGVLANPVVAAG